MQSSLYLKTTITVGVGAYRKIVIEAFSHDVTAAILVFQNNETAAMLVYKDSPEEVELFSYVKAFFCPNK